MKLLLFIVYPTCTLMLSVTAQEEEEIRAYDIPDATVLTVDEMVSLV